MTGVGNFAVFPKLPDGLGGVGIDVGRAVGLEKSEPIGAAHHWLTVIDDDDHRVVARSVLGSTNHRASLAATLEDESWSPPNTTATAPARHLASTMKFSTHREKSTPSAA
jgi:hypothetical protein